MCSRFHRKAGPQRQHSHLQTLPWNYSGAAGGTANDGYLGFEICEDGLTDHEYFSSAYMEAVELCVYLCKQYSLSEQDIICHSLEIALRWIRYC